ncbi:MAG: VWA domain-containing protein [Candidatus Hodarchaeota archaeon]
MVFPFTAMVGQEKMRLALILNVINPLIGGVLIRGERGTGKSTAIRALAQLLPDIEIVKGCCFNCDPGDTDHLCVECADKYGNNALITERKKQIVVEIPLSATEDKVVGSLDIERAIKDGIKALEPGILAFANRNILYVDEINLLSDHIIDDLLDCAAMGVNLIEREGISVSHPSKFVLVGSMNPEEGELRPQILDRLGLSVDVESIKDFNLRLQILERVEEFDKDPQKFIEIYKKSDNELQKRIVKAMEIMEQGVLIPDYLMQTIVTICIDLRVPTHRGEITIARCSKALAAFDGRNEVNEADVLTAAQLTLHHRLADMGATQEEIEKKINESFKKALSQAKEDEQKKIDEMGQDKKKSPIDEETSQEKKIPQTGMSEQLQSDFGKIDQQQMDNPDEQDFKNIDDEKQTYEFGQDGRPYKKEKIKPKQSIKDNLSNFKKFPEVAKVLNFDKKRINEPNTLPLMGKRFKKKGPINKGKYVTFKLPKEKTRSIALDATIRAAAPYQKRRKSRGLAINLEMQDIRERIFEYQAPLSIVFVLDASGSMFRMLKQMKDVIMNLHEDAYKHRDRVGLVTFQGYDAVIIQQPTVNLDLVINRLSYVQSDSWTPLASGLKMGAEVLKHEKQRNKEVIPVLVVLTDGGANVPISSIPPPPFHNFQYYQMLEEEIQQISLLLKKENIHTIVLWPENASMRGPRHKRIALSIAKYSEGVFYQIKAGAKLGQIFSRDTFRPQRLGMVTKDKKYIRTYFNS